MAGSVTGYQAGLDASLTQMSYAPETAWGTLPTTTFQAMRYISESLKHVKTRTRPQEIRGDRQEAPAVTTQEAASGSLVFPAYYSAGASASPFDDFLTGILGNDWAAPTTIIGASGDITLTWNAGTGVATLTSATAGKFSALSGGVGNMVKLKGFTNTVNNGVFRISAYASALSVSLVPQGFVPVTETPAGTAANVYFSGIKNSTFFKTFYAQQRLNPGGSLWLRYPAMYPTKMSLTHQLGQFLQATVDMIVQQELSAVADASTGGIVAAPNTKDFDPVGGFKGVFWNDALLSSACDQYSLDLSNDGAAAEFALGSAVAQGMLGGTFMAEGSFRIYIKDMTLYTSFRNETPGILTIRASDGVGNQYSISAPNAILLMTNGINASGTNKAIMGEFSMEASPDTASGATICIDRIPATA